ncbi:putative snf2 family helicase [Golovinomyces cichoracearum]|uniref:Putative snf2 family helicase n=1 Tax=Golovinomyces cichoracearum TaxID=62708 RepID=A0A420IYF8_9PEZI|nr:putative snf2 family helicase [Golovinomyces cichoracearum]
MTPTSFSIYAELLIKIRQISVLESLETPCDSNDGQQFSQFHNGHVNSLELPENFFLISVFESPYWVVKNSPNVTLE